MVGGEIRPFGGSPNFRPIGQHTIRPLRPHLDREVSFVAGRENDSRGSPRVTELDRSSPLWVESERRVPGVLQDDRWVTRTVARRCVKIFQFEANDDEPTWRRPADPASSQMHLVRSTLCRFGVRVTLLMIGRVRWAAASDCPIVGTAAGAARGCENRNANN
jgi:hypothetical protein